MVAVQSSANIKDDGIPRLQPARPAVMMRKGRIGTRGDQGKGDHVGPIFTKSFFHHPGNLGLGCAGLAGVHPSLHGPAGLSRSQGQGLDFLG